MPPRRIRSAAKPLTLGFAGSGQLDPKAINALLDDIGTVETIYVPVTGDDFTDEIAAVVKWAVKNKVEYTTVSEAEAEDDPVLSKVILAAAEDYPAGTDGAVATIIEFLAGDEENPAPEDGRLLFFFDGETEDVPDVEDYEIALSADVPCFDMCDELSPIVAEEEGTEQPVEDAPEEEEEEPKRRPRATKKVTEPVEELEITVLDRATLESMTLTELKKLAKQVDPEANTTEALRGLKVVDVVELLAGPADEEPDEAQATPPRRRRGAAGISGGSAGSAAPQEAADAAEDAAEPDGDADTREEVFARLRGNREASERIAVGLVQALKAISEQGEPDQAAERAAGAVAASLMLFAEYIVTEVRKPKSPGRPRKDGSEAQPQAKPSAEEPAKPTRRGRRSA